jgi:hypothetical protein
LKLIPLDQRRYHAFDRIWAGFKVSSNWLGYFVEQYARRIQYTQATDSRDVLSYYVFCLGTGMQESFQVAKLSALDAYCEFATHAALSFSTRTDRWSTLYMHSCRQ